LQEQQALRRTPDEAMQQSVASGFDNRNQLAKNGWSRI
jgi:hypothetical protein